MEKSFILSDFPEIYEDELLYSVVARYHNRSGNNDLKDTILDIFGSVNTIPTIEFPSRLNHLQDILPGSWGYNSDYFINNHTLFPFYAPFPAR